VGNGAACGACQERCSESRERRLLPSTAVSNGAHRVGSGRPRDAGEGGVRGAAGRLTGLGACSPDFSSARRRSRRATFFQPAKVGTRRGGPPSLNSRIRRPIVGAGPIGATHVIRVLGPVAPSTRWGGGRGDLRALRAATESDALRDRRLLASESRAAGWTWTAGARSPARRDAAVDPKGPGDREKGAYLSPRVPPMRGGRVRGEPHRGPARRLDPPRRRSGPGKRTTSGMSSAPEYGGFRRGNGSPQPGRRGVDTLALAGGCAVQKDAPLGSISSVAAADRGRTLFQPPPQPCVRAASRRDVRSSRPRSSRVYPTP
jgi:hypothetical protein